jgi:hypothetical protein
MYGDGLPTIPEEARMLVGKRIRLMGTLVPHDDLGAWKMMPTPYNDWSGAYVGVVCVDPDRLLPGVANSAVWACGTLRLRDVWDQRSHQRVWQYELYIDAAGSFGDGGPT